MSPSSSTSSSSASSSSASSSSSPAAWPSRPLRLHRHPISGHCHRVETFLSMLGLPTELVEISLEKRTHKSPEFLGKNPLGQIPVLEDGDLVLADSNAILVYLAERYDAEHRWLPRDPRTTAEIQRWFSLAAGPLAFGPAALRRRELLGDTSVNPEVAGRLASQVLGVMESTLAHRPFLVGETPTLADLSMYAYTARAPEGGLSLAEFPAVSAWLTRVEGLPRFVPMAKTTPAAR